jgi:hypothetical protein
MFNAGPAEQSANQAKQVITQPATHITPLAMLKQ